MPIFQVLVGKTNDNINFDYLPIYATLPPINEAPDIPEVLDGKALFSDYKEVIFKLGK